MTVDTPTRYLRTPADGTTTVYGVSFPLLETEQLVVELVDAETGVISTMVDGDDYTLTIAADFQSAEVEFDTAPAEGYDVVRRRVARLRQPDAISAYGRFPGGLVEDALDRLAMEAQAVHSLAERGLRVPFSEDAPEPVPYAPLRANRIMAFDADGNPIVSNLTLAEMEGGLLLNAGVDAPNLVNVAAFSSLEVNDNFTAAAEAACQWAVDHKLDGIYFPYRASPYRLSGFNIPGNMRVTGHPEAVLSATTTANGCITLDGDNIVIERLNMVGINSMQTHSGGGAVLLCQLEVVGAGPVYGLPNKDSLTDNLGLPVWAPATAYAAASAPGEDDADVIVRTVGGQTYECFVSHTSDADFLVDYRLGYWGSSVYGLTVDQGGTGYVTTLTEAAIDDPEGVGGDYFDYEVTDRGGSGGIIRCYVVDGSITRIRTIAQGSGYLPDVLSDKRRVMVMGRSYPTGRWIYTNGHSDITIRENTLMHGGFAIDCLNGRNVVIDDNYIAWFTSPGYGINFDDCVDSKIRNNIIEEIWGYYNNSAIRISSTGGGNIEDNKNLVISGNFISRTEQGIASNVARASGISVSDNVVDDCTICYLIKLGIQAAPATPGSLEEYESGVYGITFNGNVARCRSGQVGFDFQNNQQYPMAVSLDSTNITVCTDDRIGTYAGLPRNSTGVVLYNVTDSDISPTILGRFQVGISVVSAFRTRFAPVSDGRSATLFRSGSGSNHNLNRCEFQGSFYATEYAIDVRSATNPVFMGTRAVARGRPIVSLAITSAGTGGPANATIPIYAHGGGHSLKLECDITAGVISAARFVESVSDFAQGADLFDGGSGSFQVKVRQNGGSGGILTVTVVNGEATAVVITNGGSGYLDGRTGTNMYVEMGADFIGQVTTNGSGAVVTATVLDRGGHYVELPDLTFASSVTWGTPPVITPAFSNSVFGLIIDNVLGGSAIGAHFEGEGGGLYMQAGVSGFNVLNSRLVGGVAGRPLYMADQASPGIMHNVTHIYSTGVVPLQYTPVSNTINSIGELNYVNTGSAPQTVSTIKGMIGETTVRISSNSNALTFNTSGNIYLGGLGTLILSNTTDWATFRWNPITSKAELVMSSGTSTTYQPARTELTLYGTKGANIASASTVDLSTATGDWVDVTGTTTITGFGTAAAGVVRTIRTTGILQITHNATSLILPGGRNITTAAGDMYVFRSLGSGNWVLVGRDTQLDQQTAITGATTLTAGNLNRTIRCDASGGAFTVKLPSSALEGEWVETVKSDSGSNRVTVQVDAVATDRAWLSAQDDRVRWVWWSGAWVARETKFLPLRDLFTGSGTWTKPPLSKEVEVFIISSSSGGGSGRRGAAGSARAGGSASNAAWAQVVKVPASSLSATETVTIGAGGTGGASVTVDDTNGNNGSSGGNTTFGSILGLTSQTAGVGGTTTTTAVNNARLGVFWPATPGGSGVATGSAGGAGNTGVGPGGGGGGGGVTTGNVGIAGGSGGGAGGNTTGSLSAGAAGAIDGNGGNGASISDTWRHYGGAGGGGGGGSAAGPGGRGGDGGAPGGGAGGGGASVNGQASGAGGDGARGEIRVTTFF